MKVSKKLIMTPRVVCESLAHIAAKSADTVETRLAPLGMSVASLVESPIELKFLLAIKLKYELEFHAVMEILSQDQLNVFPEFADLILVPQFVLNNNGPEMRIDFAVLHGEDKSIAVAIECDGHDFHERTKEQAIKDRSRDRVVQSLGVPIFRFTGSEIHNDPFGCADEVLSFIFRF